MMSRGVSNSTPSTSVANCNVGDSKYFTIQWTIGSRSEGATCEDASPSGGNTTCNSSITGAVYNDYNAFFVSNYNAEYPTQSFTGFSGPCHIGDSFMQTTTVGECNSGYQSSGDVITWSCQA